MAGDHINGDRLANALGRRPYQEADFNHSAKRGPSATVGRVAAGRLLAEQALERGVGVEEAVAHVGAVATANLVGQGAAALDLAAIG